MSFNNSFTAVTGATYTAAQYNTHTRDNFTAIFVGTTAGDMDYYTGAAAKARLAIGAAYTLVRSNAAGNAPEYGQAPFVVKYHYDGTGHSYNSVSERDMPNSSNTMTLLVTSTIIMVARIVSANAAGNCWTWFRVQISGNVGEFSQINYGSTTVTTTAFGIKTGVTAGTKTLLLREKEGYGSALSYAVANLAWIALAIPEQ